jgi:hypothetical protein
MDMTEEQMIDVSPTRAAPSRHPAAIEVPWERWEGEGGAVQTDELAAEPSKVTAVSMESRTGPSIDDRGGDPVDPDAVTEQHFFAESEDQLGR